MPVWQFHMVREAQASLLNNQGIARQFRRAGTDFIAAAVEFPVMRRTGEPALMAFDHAADMRAGAVNQRPLRVFKLRNIIIHPEYRDGGRQRLNLIETRYDHLRAPGPLVRSGLSG